VPIAETIEIPGRNGTLLYETGAFENRKGKAVCFCLSENVDLNIRAINNFLFSSIGYRRLETSDDPYHFWLARISNGSQIEQRARMLNPFEIVFDCKPQRFLKCGEIEETFSASKTDNVIFNNTAFPAKPIIKVYGSGEGTIFVGDHVVEIKKTGISPITLDCDTQNAYSAAFAGNLNKYVNAPEFPILKPGENEISIEGNITALSITPRWWEL
jgi:phage-related protein